MGIKSLTKLIKNKSPESIVTSQYHKLSGKRIAIDANVFSAPEPIDNGRGS